MSKSKPTPAEIKTAVQQMAVLWRPHAIQEGATAAQVAQHIVVLKRALEEAERVKATCHHCQHFSIEHCSLHGAVPADFARQEGACDDWRSDGVPF